LRSALGADGYQNRTQIDRNPAPPPLELEGRTLSIFEEGSKMVKSHQTVAIALCAAIALFPIITTTSVRSASLDIVCEGLTPQKLQQTLSDAGSRAFASQLGAVNLAQKVSDEWNISIGDLFDKAVDRNVEIVEGNHGYLSRQASNYWPPFASGMQQEVVHGIFSDESLARGLDQLRTNILTEAVARISGLDADFDWKCLHEYARSHLDERARRDLESYVVETQLKLNGSPQVNRPISAATPPVLLGGAAVAARIETKIESKVGEKIVESVSEKLVARLASKVLGVVGLAALAYDAYAGRNGALPGIGELLHSDVVKDEIKAGITAELEESAQAKKQQVVDGVQADIMSKWTEFLKQHSM
jgi:hypothetical protein